MEKLIKCVDDGIKVCKTEVGDVRGQRSGAGFLEVKPDWFDWCLVLMLTALTVAEDVMNGFFVSVIKRTKY